MHLTQPGFPRSWVADGAQMAHLLRRAISTGIACEEGPSYMVSVSEIHTSPLSLLSRAAVVLREIVEAFSHARTANARYQFLSALSDEELADRGLSRDMIAHRATEGYLKG